MSDLSGGKMPVRAREASFADAPLRGCRVLVTEDEYFLADDIARSLRSLGAKVAGPVSELEDALGILDSGETIDGAVLDVNLKGEMIFPIARALRARNLPFVFTTGYDRAAVDPEFQDVLVWEKPLDLIGMTHTLAGLIRRR
jgi:CheY-like chemotaxis protein